MSNLPSWYGADMIYSRLTKVCNHLNAQAYKAQRAAWKRKTGFRFSSVIEADCITDALNKGDEETLKALSLQYIHIWGCWGATENNG